MPQLYDDNYSGGSENRNGDSDLAFRPFPLWTLPKAMREFVTVASLALGCDPSCFAVAVLAVAAGAIGNTRQLWLKNSWQEPGVVWAVLVMPSGSMKSSILGHAVKPVHAIQRRYSREWREDEARYARELREWKANRREGDEPKPPKRLRHALHNDVTVEALIDSGMERGAFVVHDEIVGAVDGFGQYKGGKGTDLAHYLNMFRAGSVKRDRMGGDRKTVDIPNAALSMVGTTQPATLLRRLNGPLLDSGFWQRFLFVVPPVAQKQWTEADIGVAEEERWAKVVEALFAMQPSMASNGDTYPTNVTLSAEGKAEWVAFFNEHAAVQPTIADPSFAAAWSKLEGYAARFALIIHCARHADGEDVDPWEADADDIRAGVALTQWFAHEARRTYAMLGEGEAEGRERSLVDFIRSKGGTVTVREVRQGMWRYRDDPASARADLQSLMDEGLGFWAQRKSKGRAHPVFTLGPATAEPPPAVDVSDDLTRDTRGATGSPNATRPAADEVEF